MLTVDDYVDIAKRLRNLKSDNALAKQMGLTSPTVSGWRNKRAWPTDATMVKLAHLAKMDPKQALVHLNIWRTDGEANQLYREIMDSWLDEDQPQQAAE